MKKNNFFIYILSAILLFSIFYTKNFFSFFVLSLITFAMYYVSKNIKNIQINDLLKYGCLVIIGNYLAFQFKAMFFPINLSQKILFIYYALFISFIINIIIQLNTLKKNNTDIKNTPHNINTKILDTSAIIDGRILDIFNLNFLDGQIVIPKFVLKELQTISDSKDNLKRNRGRRGLDILNKIQNNLSMPVNIIEKDYPETAEVDEKLIKLAQEFNYSIMTNDYNLNKIAEFQNITVLNINDLANALKPVMLPGEKIEILIVKEGKENNQGIGYLGDGTMVVIDNANREINKTVKAIVTSTIQTSAGRMIFGKKPEDLKD